MISIKTNSTASDRRGTWTLLMWLVVFCTGFGAMSLFWLFHDHSVERGLFDFISATWGDGLFLPIMAASMLAYVLNIGAPLSKGYKRLCWVIAAIAALAGACIPLSWLISDDTVLNWTIPAPHRFNAPGYYHAGFMAFMFGLSFYLLTRVALARCSTHCVETNQSSKTDAAYVLMWFGGCGYAFMRIGETGDWDLSQPLTVLAAIGVLFVIGIVFTLVQRKRNVRTLIRECRLVLAGVLLAFAVSGWILGLGPPSHSLVLFPAAVALFCVSLLVPRVQRIDRTLVVVLLLGACGAGFGMIMVTATDLVSSAVVTGLFVIVVLFIAVDQNRDAATRVERLPLDAATRSVALLIMVMVFGVLNIPEISATLEGSIPSRLWSELVEWVPRGGIVGFTAWIMINSFLRYASYPETDRLPGVRQRTALVKRTLWVLIICLFCGATLLALLVFTGEISDAARPEMSLMGLVSSLVIAGSSIGLFLCGNRRESDMAKAVSIPLLLVLFAALVGYVCDLRMPWLLHAFEWYLLFSILGSALFIAHGLRANMMTLLGEADNRYSLVMVVIVGVGVASVFACSVLPTRSSTQTFLASLTSPAIGVLGCIVGAILPTILVARIIRPKNHSPHVLYDSEIGGVIQDSMMGAFMAIGSGLLFIHLISAQGIAKAIMFVSYFVAVYLAVRATLRNNYHHLANPRSTRLDFIAAADQGRPLDKVQQEQAQLKFHLERQALLVATALFPWSLGLIVEWICTLFLGRTRRHLANYLYSKFLLDLSFRTHQHSITMDEQLGLNVSTLEDYRTASIIT